MAAHNMEDLGSVSEGPRNHPGGLRFIVADADATERVPPPGGRNQDGMLDHYYQGPKMVKEEVEIAVSKDIQENWQEIVNILAQLCEVPAALIMRLADPDIEVFIDSGLYCETVIKFRNKRFVPDALADAHWKNNSDVKLTMISYLGFPILCPTTRPM